MTEGYVIPEEMKQRWFGKPWPNEYERAPVCENDADRIDVPLGEACWLCEELIDVDDQGYRHPHLSNEASDFKYLYCHRECMLHNVMGCLSHLTGNGHDHTNSDMTYRQESILIMAWLSTQAEHRE